MDAFLLPPLAKAVQAHDRHTTIYQRVAGLCSHPARLITTRGIGLMHPLAYPSAKMATSQVATAGAIPAPAIPSAAMETVKDLPISDVNTHTRNMSDL